MCYSAQILADYRRYVRMFGADISIREFVDLFWRRAQGAKVPIPKAMEAAFAAPVSDAEQEIKTLIDRFAGEQETRFQQEVFKPARNHSTWLHDGLQTISERPRTFFD